MATAFTLPGRYYTSHELYQEELERIFYDHWVCMGRMEQIPDSGNYLVQQVGDESLIIVRGEGQTIRAFYNVCRHRGTRICTASEGRLRQSIQCPYHAWTYGLDGRLIGAPHMKDVAGFKAEDYGLQPAALDVWEGFLFVNLASKPEPFSEALAPLLGKFARWHLPKLRAARRIEYDVRANWKLIIQNYSECYHCPLIHPDLARISPYRSGNNDLTEGPILGGYMLINPSEHSLTLDGQNCAPPLGEVGGDDLHRVYYYSILPNMLMSLHPDYVLVHTLWPQSPDRTLIRCEWLFEPEAMAQPNFDPDSAVSFWDMTNRQDWHVCELSQRGVASRAYRPGPYSTGEGLLAAFDRELLRALGHRA